MNHPVRSFPGTHVPLGALGASAGALSVDKRASATARAAVGCGNANIDSMSRKLNTAKKELFRLDISFPPTRQH